MLMSKKITKTTEQLTEEFFACERTEYEKRVPKAFPRVATFRLDDAAVELLDDEPPPEIEPPVVIEEKEK